MKFNINYSLSNGLIFEEIPDDIHTNLGVTLLNGYYSGMTKAGCYGFDCNIDIDTTENAKNYGEYLVNAFHKFNEKRNFDEIRALCSFLSDDTLTNMVEEIESSNNPFTYNFIRVIYNEISERNLTKEK